MGKCGDELRELAHRMMHEKWDYKSQTKKYVRQVMGMYRQEELMEGLRELNYKELKMIAGCGVPGDAWRLSFDLLKEKRLEVELFIEKHGQQAKAIVEVNPDEEGEDDGDAGIQTSEAR
jgi:hypothetical protein